MPISVGYAQNSITPSLELPVFLAGFGHNRCATEIHDDLFVRALALCQPGAHLLLASVDLIGLGRAFCQRVESRLQKLDPLAQLILSSTHTHHGPDTIGLWGPDLATRGVDEAYMQWLENGIVDTCTAALARPVPATLRAAAIQVNGVVRNARDPEILDQELIALQWVDPDSNQLLVSLCNFPCHPETLWEHNPVITSDYPHFLRLMLECETGAPCLFFSAALGGMMTPDVVDHSFDDAERIGLILEQAAMKGLARQSALDLDSFTYRRVEFQIPLKNPIFEGAIQAGLVKDTQVQEGQIKTQAGLLKLGPAWFVHVPGELLPKLGLQFKAEMRAAGAQVAGVLGLANDELGYILPDEDYLYPSNPFDPGDHYEETMSDGPTAGSSLTAAFRTLLIE